MRVRCMSRNVGLLSATFYGSNPHMAQVEEAYMSQVNRLVMQHILRNHVKRDTEVSEITEQPLTDPKTSKG